MQLVLSGRGAQVVRPLRRGRVQAALRSTFLATLPVPGAFGFHPAGGICGTARRRVPRCWSAGRWGPGSALAEVAMTGWR